MPKVGRELLDNYNDVLRIAKVSGANDLFGWSAKLFSIYIYI